MYNAVGFFIPVKLLPFIFKAKVVCFINDDVLYPAKPLYLLIPALESLTSDCADSIVTEKIEMYY